MTELATLNDRIRSRLIRKEGKTQAGLAKACGISTSAVAQWMTGANGINYKHISAIAKYLGVREKWLLTGQGPIEDFSSKMEPVGAYHEDDPVPPGYVAIPEFRICFGAGSHTPPTFEEVTESRKALYRLDFFEELNADPDGCKRVKVSGDSMEPTLCDGDTVLVVEDYGRIIDGDIYVFSVRDELMIKRLYRRANGTIVIHSDNEDGRYIDEVLTPEDQEREYFRVYGHAVERVGAL